MRKALIVGIDYYEHVGSLSGCVNDAHAIKLILERHSDGTRNFVTPEVIVGTGPSNIVTRERLRMAVRTLFEGDPEIALFYFAGHGFIEDTGGFLCASDCRTGDDGVALSDLMEIARRSKARNKLLMLDSCHSGVVGERAATPGTSEIHEGMTVLTASTADQFAMEVPGGGAGVFTTLLVDALSGAAANLLGEITPGSVYAHIDQSLGPFAQRPVFKTNVKTFVSLRKVSPPIPLADLQALTTHFPRRGFKFALDPSYEPERYEEQKKNSSVPAPDPTKTSVFATLQRYAKVNLVKAIDAPHMWHAAMNYKSCELTVLGEHYRNLVAKGLI
jgi:hypothetical protein